MTSLVVELGVIKGATVPAIIEWLIKENQDNNVLDHFFSSFPQFMKATDVWDQFNRYVHAMSDDELKDSLPSYVFLTAAPAIVSGSDALGASNSGSIGQSPLTYSTQKPKNLRECVFNFLYAWIERSFYRDFLQTKRKQQKMFDGLLHLLSSLNNDTANRYKLLMIRAVHERKRRTRLIKLRSGAPVRSNSGLGLNTSAPAPSAANAHIASAMRELQLSAGGGGPGTPNKERPTKIALEPGKFEFLDLDPMDVAAQLTIIEFDMYRSIQESELYHLAWRNDNAKRLKLAPNVVKLVERFNTVSFWVATEIVMVTGVRERVQVLRKFIQVAEHLKEMGNYNGVMEVIGGINMWAVTRLKNTWEQLPPRSHTIVEELNALMESKSNYKNYRTALKTSKLPVMPYLGVYLRDLTFIEENKDWYGDDKNSGLFNFEKLQLIGQVITELKKFQTSEYLLERNEVLQEYLTKLLTLPEEMLIKHSQLCEPTSRDSH